MITTDLEYAAFQIPPHEGLQRALEFLRARQWDKWHDGEYPIDGRRIYAVISTYETSNTPAQPLLEGHHRYIDVQFIATGTEVIAWAPAGAVQVTTPYDETHDIWFGTLAPDAVTPLQVAAGCLAVLFPNDAHAPKRACGAPSPVRKVLVKVAL